MTSVELRALPLIGAFAFAFALAVVAAPARAALGGDAASIEQDRARLGALQSQAQMQTQTRTQAQAQTPSRPQGQVRVQVLALSDGSAVREFVAPGGRVFAIAWSTRLKPRLDGLLGAQSVRYASAARSALLVPGARHALSIDEGDLVVHATSRLNSHVGFAYLRSLVPAGVSVDALR